MTPPPWLSDAATAFSAQVTPADPAQAPRQVTLPGGIPDVVTGTDVADGGQQVADSLDETLTAQLADQIAVSWPGLDDQSREMFRKSLAAALAAAAGAAGQLAFRVPSAGTAEPGAGTILMPGHIGGLLTGAFGSDAPVDALLTLTAEQLQRAQLGLERIFTDNDQATQEMLLGPNPDDSDPDMLASLQMLIDDLNGAPAGSSSPAGTMHLPEAGTSGMIIQVPAAWRAAIGPARDALRTLWGKSPSTGRAGDLAHAVLQADYLRTYPTREVLIDAELRLPGAKDLLAPPDLSNPEIAAVIAALSLSRKQPSEPDILDLTTRQVYEIKTLDQFLQGIVQLFCNYLLPLNASVLGENIARQMLDSLSPVTGLPSGWNNPNNVAFTDLWTPGTEWTPLPFYPISPDLYIWAVRPLPGLVLYKYVSRKRKVDTVSDVKAAMTSLATDTAMTMVLAAVAATLRPGLTPSGLSPVLAQMAGLESAAFASNADALAALLPPPPGELSWNAICLAAAAVVVLTVVLVLTGGAAGALEAGAGASAGTTGIELTEGLELETAVENFMRKAA